MFKLEDQQHIFINAPTTYFQANEHNPKLQQQQSLKYISRIGKYCKLLKNQKLICKKVSPTKVTVTENIRESERICGAAPSGINIDKFKHKMANTLSVMTNVLRNVVSKQRIRYKENGYNLDLAYICDNIIAMGYPADNIESIFRNRLEDVYKFLQEIHQNHYKIYNLCLERSYDSNKFHGRVAVYPFEDHNPPTIELIQRFCLDVDTWLKADIQNVAAVHCKAGKGRTGTMICCYLLYSGQQHTAADALECYAEKRTKDRKGVTIPSQRRYVQYFAKLISSGVPYEKRYLQFCEIRFTEANLLHSNGTVHCSISRLEDNGCSVKVVPLLSLPIDFRKSYTLDLKNQSLCVYGDIKVELTHKKKLFHFWFNTYFVRDDAVIEDEGKDSKLVYTLHKCEIDDAHKDKEHKCFSEGFKVQLVFYAETTIRPDLQANVSSIASQIGNNQRLSQNARISHQNSCGGGGGGGGDSSSSSNCQLPQNSSSGSDLNYICDQKSSSSASASVSSLGGHLIGDGGGGGGSGSGSGSVGVSGNIGEPNYCNAVPTDFSHVDVSRSYVQHLESQQQQKPRISLKQKHIAANSITGDVDGYTCEENLTPFGRSAHTLNLQQHQHQHQQLQHADRPSACCGQRIFMPAKNKSSDCDGCDCYTGNMPYEGITDSPTTACAPLPLLQQQQQQKNDEGMPVSYKQFLAAINISGDCDAYDCDSDISPMKRINSTAPPANAPLPQQQPQNPYVNLQQMIVTADKQQQIMKSLMRPKSQNHTTTVERVSNNINNGNSNRQLVDGNGTVILQSNGAVGEGSETNGCISANSSKSSISSHTSSTASTTSCSSSAPTSGGDKDCEEEDWESGECHPKMLHTNLPKALQLPTLLASSKPSTANSTITFSNNITSTYPNNTTTVHSYTPSTTTTYSKQISNSTSILPQQSSTFSMNKNIYSGSYNCSYCGCDDDENKNNPNLKYKCSHFHDKGKMQKINFNTNERRSSCTTVSKLNGAAKNVFISKEVVNKCGTEVNTGGKIVTGIIELTSKSPLNSGDSAVRTTTSSLLVSPLKKSDATNSNSCKQNHASNVGNVVSSWAHKPLFQHKFNTKKLREYNDMSCSTAIAVKKSNCTVASSTADAALLALSVSPASGCSGLASTSRRKLKNKLKNNTKKLSHWLQNHFRTNPVEFCENFAQHTTTMRRNSNCSVGSRSHKLSMSSNTVTVTPGSSLPKRQLLMSASKDKDNEVVNVETYDIYGEVENVLKEEVLLISDHGGDENRDGNVRTKVSLSESTTASNVSLSTVGGGSTGRGGHDDSSDAFEDFYSSNCDNQLSFNNSPCKSPRSLVDIAGSSAYGGGTHELYATSLNEKNVHLQLLRREQLHMPKNVNVQPLGQHHHHHNMHQHQQRNVVVIAAKPAKTHAIGFNVTEDKASANVSNNEISTTQISPNTSAAETYENPMNTHDITIGANVTIVTTEMEQVVEEQATDQQQLHNISGYRASINGSELFVTKIDEVDENDVEDDGATTASSVYYTPTTSACFVDGTESDNVETNQVNHPFVFPNVRNELEKILPSDYDNQTATELRRRCVESASGSEFHCQGNVVVTNKINHQVVDQLKCNCGNKLLESVEKQQSIAHSVSVVTTITQTESAAHIDDENAKQ
ncbi:uncharacterized protein LOC101450346 [Ceratitis capitata]|nr:uncharacterized protein LOC101450346 [Ceratitis capitata]